eukprot:s1257_g28.t1
MDMHIPASYGSSSRTFPLRLRLHFQARRTAGHVHLSRADHDSSASNFWGVPTLILLPRKAAIRDSVGFEQVNQHVRKALVDWIGQAVRKQFQELVDAAMCDVTGTAVCITSPVWPVSVPESETRAAPVLFRSFALDTMATRRSNVGFLLLLVALACALLRLGRTGWIRMIGWSEGDAPVGLDISWRSVGLRGAHLVLVAEEAPADDGDTFFTKASNFPWTFAPISRFSIGKDQKFLQNFPQKI